MEKLNRYNNAEQPGELAAMAKFVGQAKSALNSMLFLDQEILRIQFGSIEGHDPETLDTPLYN